MSQSTPGPWRCNFDPSWYPWEGSIEIEDGCETIAWLTSNAKQRNLDEANARLIAAAPDLLAALQHVVQWFDQLKPEDIARYRIAIAKATGEA